MDDASFLAAIAANPADDAARWMYADWLDERRDSESSARARYLRLACSLPIVGRNEPEVFETRRVLAELGDELPAEWEIAVARPHAVVLESIAEREGLKRAAVVAICQATGLNLYHGVLLVGGMTEGSDVVARRVPPKVIVQAVTFGRAETVAQNLRDSCGAQVRVITPRSFERSGAQ